MTKNEILAKYLLKNRKINQKVYDALAKKFDNEDFDVLEDLLLHTEISSFDKIDAYASLFDVPSIDLDYVSISQNIEKFFSLELMKKYLFLPLYVSKNNTLILGTTDILNPELKSIVEILYDGKIEYVVVEKEKVVDFLNSYEATITTKNALSTISNDADSAEKSSTDDLYVQDAPAVKFVDSIIREALPLKASDIHIEPGELNVVIRYRIDGDLVKWTEFPIVSFPEIAARIKILSGIDIAEKRVPQDGRITMNFNGEDVNFRVSTLPTIYGEKFVIRILDNKIFSYSLKELNFSPKANKLIEQSLNHPHGIILLTGPTGSGKTTTLYAFLRELNNGKKNIVTIEDPVEYAMKDINQIQVNKKANLTFASSLRSILRQDPDIIMIGEIRDEETAQIATRAAITGHLVLSTLHTNDSTGAVIRLVDMGIPQYLVGDALVAVLSQRLVKKLCPNCKKKVKATKSMMEALGVDNKETYIYKPQGCPYCNNSGYKGRTAIHEILYLNQNIKQKISEGSIDFESLKKLAVENGMVTLSDACKSYVLDGTTSFDEYVNIMLGDK